MVMKIFGKLVCMLICVSMILGILASCDVKVDLGEDVYVSDIYLNEQKELVVKYDDDTEVNFGGFAVKDSAFFTE